MNVFSKGFTVFITGLLFSICSFSNASELYKWTDESGNIHYSNSFPNVPDKQRGQVEKKNYEDNRRTSLPAKTHVIPYKKNLTSGEKLEGKEPKRYVVPYKPYGGSSKRVIVAATLNGTVTAPLAIDTGAPGTLISVSLAKRLGLFEEDQGKLKVTAGGIGGVTPAIRSIIDTIQVGGAKSEFVPITIINQLPEAFEGLLGLDFVSNYAMTIDSKKRVVVFEEIPGDTERPGGHDQGWWNALFKEFAAYRNYWKNRSEDKKLRDTMRYNGTDADRKTYADKQYMEAEKLLKKLEHYAIDNAVPMHWRQY